MTWEQIVLISFITITCLSTILSIGKKREPITPGVAVTVLAIDVSLIYLITRI